jgi:hypothetical protein
VVKEGKKKRILWWGEEYLYLREAAVLAFNVTTELTWATEPQAGRGERRMWFFSNVLASEETDEKRGEKAWWGVDELAAQWSEDGRWKLKRQDGDVKLLGICKLPWAEALKMQVALWDLIWSALWQWYVESRIFWWGGKHLYLCERPMSWHSAARRG